MLDLSEPERPETLTEVSGAACRTRTDVASSSGQPTSSPSLAPPSHFVFVNSMRASKPAPGRLLDTFRPFVTSANVRTRFDSEGLVVGSGTGHQGDLVLGEVQADPERPVTVFDQHLGVHSLSTPTRVLAPLGTRESSTHVNGGLPEGGLDVFDGRDACWLAGESGLVGLLFAEGRPIGGSGVETSTPFRLTGLVQRADGTPVNVADYAVTTNSPRLTIPVICVGATSSEAGKTVLTQKVIRAAVAAGARVGAIKTTGTGGTIDSSHHRAAGADIVLDQVDGGQITTYGPPGPFRERITPVFRHAQELGADAIVAELGGDLVWANNPTFLTMPEMVACIRSLFVIGNDALACAGAVAYLENPLEFPTDRVRLFSSPFRNHFGQVKRMPVLGLGDLYDPNDPDAVSRLVAEALT